MNSDLLNQLYQELNAPPAMAEMAAPNGDAVSPTQFMTTIMEANSDTPLGNGTSFTDPTPCPFCPNPEQPEATEEVSIQTLTERTRPVTIPRVGRDTSLRGIWYMNYTSMAGAPPGNYYLGLSTAINGAMAWVMTNGMVIIAKGLARPTGQNGAYTIQLAPGSTPGTPQYFTIYPRMLGTRLVLTDDENIWVLSRRTQVRVPPQ